MSIGARERRTGGRERRLRRKLRVHFPVFLLLVGLIFLIAAVKLWQPFAAARRQEEELARLKAQKAALQSEQKQLEEYKRRLASDQGLEATAREKGYVKPGERLLVFVREKPAGKSKAKSRK